MGFQANRITEEIQVALAALQTKATLDAQALATFNNTNEELRQQLKAATERIQQLEKTSGTPATHKYYCWSHGYRGHNSKDCKFKKEGHKDDATVKDNKGGSQIGRNKPLA